MSHTVTYNGYSLPNVEFTSYQSEQVLAEDGVSRESMKHTVQGRTYFFGTGASDFVSELNEARAKFGAPRGNLQINFADDATNGNIVLIEGGDEFDGPHAKLDITRIAGTRTAIGTFEIVWHKLEVSSGTIFDILSHRWTQQFSYDESGVCTWMVAGALRVKANATTGEAGDYVQDQDTDQSTNNPDAWRLAVTPKIPGGFRRTRLEYAVDETGNRLLYTCEARQFHRDLPAVARTGDASFRWNSSLDDMMGTKVFEVELTGAPRTSISSLVRACVRLSANRILWNGPGHDIVQAIELEELRMFDAPSVRLRILARSQRDLTEGDDVLPRKIAPLGNIMTDIPGQKDISVYGSALIMAARRTLFDPTDTELPKAEYEDVPSSATRLAIPTPDSEFVFPADAGEVLEQNLLGGPPQDSGIANVTEDQRQFAYIAVMLSERVEIMDAGMVAIPSLSVNGSDLVMQTKPPRVRYHTSATLRRNGAPPQHHHLAPPSGAVLVSSDTGDLQVEKDARGNAVYVRTSTSVYDLARVPEALGFVVQSRGTGNLVAFQLPGGALRAPRDPRFEDTKLPASADETIFATDEYNWTIPAQFGEPYTP